MLLLAACAPSAPPPPPELAAVGEAVVAWRAGRDALAAGDAAEAVAAFERAVAARPQDALLQSWLAAGLLARGDADAARARLDEALARSPRLGAARVWRARLRLDAGDLEGAAEDVRAAVQLGAVSPRALVRDAAFRAVAGRPPFEDLPETPVTARLEGPASVVFRGSEASVTAVVEGAPSISSPRARSRSRVPPSEASGMPQATPGAW